MKPGIYISVLMATTLIACAHNTELDAKPMQDPLYWLEGCWLTNDGVEETWVRSKSGDQLFGFSVTSKRGKRVFFEQLRIDLSGKQARLFAYPRGIGPTPFEGILDEMYSVDFVNPENDYPQLIRYTFIEGRVEATISLLDKTNENSWSYYRCE